MDAVSPAENALFTKALRFLYERLAQLNGFEVEARPRLPDKDP